MKSFDEISHMTDDERADYLKEEVEKVIQNAPPTMCLKLRALQARLDRVRAKYSNAPPIVTAELMYSEMIRSLNELNEVLK